MEMKKRGEEITSTYETGVTQPGKSHRGIIAVLLMVVIFLSGVVTAMGLMNIHLFRQLNRGSDSPEYPVSFEAPTADGAGISSYARMDVGTQVEELGIWYVMISGVCNQYYDIPMGLLDTSAEGQAKNAGIRAGDILRSVNGQALTVGEQLQAVLDSCEEEAKVKVVFYRVSEETEWEVTIPVVK